MGALKVVGWIWALPVSLFGALLALVASAKPARRLPEGGILFVSTGGLSGWFFKRFGFSAITFGVVVVMAAWEDLDDPILLRHERQHTLQVFVLGPFFPLFYYGASLWALLRGRHPYFGNWFEVQARAAEQRVEGARRLE